MPNRTLRALWVAMAQLRLLDERLSQIKRRPKAHAATLSGSNGEEACRATTAIHLAAGDLISDNGPTHATDLLRARPLAEILHSAYSEALGRAHKPSAHLRKAASASKRSTNVAHLPQPASVLNRLHMALGAAAALKAAQTSSRQRTSPREPGSLVLAYASASDLAADDWQPLFALIAASSLPILLVVLPPGPDAGRSRAEAGTLSHLATRSGVPGILVDSDDPIALYRVATESFGRIRGGDGAVLIECCRLPQSPGHRHPRGEHDALERLRHTLLERRLATPAWFERTRRAFRERLQAADR